MRIAYFSIISVHGPLWQLALHLETGPWLNVFAAHHIHKRGGFTMKKCFTRITALICLVLALVFATACQQTAAGGLPDHKTIEAYEAQYGNAAADVTAALKLSESDYTTDGAHSPGNLVLTAKKELAGEAFTEELLFMRADPQTFYGVDYILGELDPGQLAAVAQTLLADAKAAYGEMSTYPGLDGRLSAEGIMEKIKSGASGSWTETWNVGKNTVLTLRAAVSEGVGSIGLHYQIETAK